MNNLKENENYIKDSKKTFICVFADLTFLLTVISIIGSGFIIWLQLISFGDVYVTPKHVKLILAGLMVLWVMLYFLLPFRKANKKFYSSPIELQAVVLILFFYSILFFCFIVIVVLSSSDVGIRNAVEAFLYNYSLTIFAVPFVLLSINLRGSSANSVLCNSSCFWKGIFVVLIFSSILQTLQMVLNSPLLMWEDSVIMHRAYEAQFIKFDQIGGVYRAQGIFRSPLEAGICSIGALLVSMERMLRSNRTIMWGFFSLILIMGIVATGSRTVYLMLVCSLGCFIFLEFMYSKKARLLIFVLCMVLVPGIIAGWLMLGGDLTGENVFSVMLDPRNLIIRLENWTVILSHVLSSPSDFLIGMGKIQNGNYGDYHSNIIDNTYLGVLVSSGLIGLLGWIVLVGLWINYYRTISCRRGRVSHLITSFFLGFLFAGLTENLMHISFYLLIVIMAYEKYLFDLVKVKAERVEGVNKSV